HGVRGVGDLAYRDYIERELPHHELLGEVIRDKLLYYPAVSREDFRHAGRNHRGRITEQLDSGHINEVLGLEPLDSTRDRAMICGSPQMLADLRAILDARGFSPAPRIGTPGAYVFERAFVEK
ncbi:MAG: ferredoxin--NADP reductase, partial [Pseudomonadota bacterium]|nr:ferredoxin--NADP reductase [Pseudomonadota bacterium]